MQWLTTVKPQKLEKKSESLVKEIPVASKGKRHEQRSLNSVKLFYSAD